HGRLTRPASIRPSQCSPGCPRGRIPDRAGQPRHSYRMARITPCTLPLGQLQFPGKDGMVATAQTRQTPSLPRALFVWAAALCAYIVAVAGRSSLGVAGPEAAERFEISATTLSSFAIMQLAVYAAAQIPVGLVLDRLGSRTMIIAGSLILATG